MTGTAASFTFAQTIKRAGIKSDFGTIDLIRRICYTKSVDLSDSLVHMKYFGAVSKCINAENTEAWFLLAGPNISRSEVRE